MLDLVGAWVLPISAACVALALWQVFVVGWRVPPAILPPPTAVATALIDASGDLVRHALATGREVVVAFFLATALGFAIATVITASRLLRSMLFPNILAFELVPKIALAPLFLIWLGVGTPSRLAFATFISFFPIVISVTTGMSGVDRGVLNLCRSLGASPWQTFWHVRVPFALPYLFVGMRIAVTLACIGVIVGEFLSSKAGLGYLIVYAGSLMRTDLMLAGIMTLCVLGLAVFGLVQAAERLVQRWYVG